MKKIQTYTQYIKESNNERVKFFFHFYFSNVFFNFYETDNESLYYISDKHKKDHYNLCSQFKDKCGDKINTINEYTKVFSCNELSRIYLDYFIEWCVYNILGFDGVWLTINWEEVYMFENIQIDQIYILFDNMIDFSSNEKIEEYFLEELDKHVDVITFFDNDKLSKFSDNFKQKIQHLLDAKNFDLI